MVKIFYRRLQSMRQHSDVVLAIGVIGLVLLLIIPIPPLFLDALLCFSIVFSIMTLLLTIYIENALEFSVFPSLLLFLTLFRLGLNVASTRMILTWGEGGDIIRTFGEFVIQGSTAIGLILFLLMTVINFIVVTKGAGRIAEVAARFTLEALPGKQMAIDGELSSGLITQVEAKTARAHISQEADFYGAMDGASKFVRGEAIASLVITGVNIVGGFMIGLFVRGYSLQKCWGLFTCLTIGDGLISQIPALLVSIGAAVMVTRASKGSVGKALTKQVFHHPKVLFLAGITLLVLSFLPGMPIIVMIPISLFFLSYSFVQSRKKEEVETPLQTTSTKSSFVVPIELQLGFQNISLAAPLYSNLPALRKKIETHLGISVPSIQITDSCALSPTGWMVRIKGNPVLSGREGEVLSILKSLEIAIESHAHELINRQQISQLLQEVKIYNTAVIDELIPKKLALGQLVNVLQNLLKERVPIKDLITILEILADHATGEKSDLVDLTERVRRALCRNISEEFFGQTHIANVITIDPKVEQMFDVSKGNMRAGTLDKLLEKILGLHRDAEKQKKKPVLVTSTSSRAYIKKIVEKSLPDLPVLSYSEISSDVVLQLLGNVSTDVLI